MNNAASDIYVYQLKLPAGINEMVTPDNEGGYTIYIDCRLSDSKKIEAYRYALRHCSGDFERPDVSAIENEAHY